MANKVTTLKDSSTNDNLYPRTKASAVTDDNGNALGPLAVYQAQTLVSGCDPINIGVDMDLLWTNASPSSTFSNQTISLDLSEYKNILIIIKVTSKEWYMSSIIPMDLSEKVFTAGIFYGPYYRGATVSTTGVTFSNGGDATNTLPYKIYGIR